MNDLKVSDKFVCGELNDYYKHSTLFISSFLNTKMSMYINVLR